MNFIPLHLGLGHISRKDFMKNRTQKVAQIFFADDKDDVAILVIDGTYIH